MTEDAPMSFKHSILSHESAEYYTNHPDNGVIIMIYDKSQDANIDYLIFYNLWFADGILLFVHARFITSASVLVFYQQVAVGHAVCSLAALTPT